MVCPTLFLFLRQRLHFLVKVKLSYRFPTIHALYAKVLLGVGVHPLGLEHTDLEVIPRVALLTGVDHTAHIPLEDIDIIIAHPPRIVFGYLPPLQLGDIGPLLFQPRDCLRGEIPRILIVAVIKLFGILNDRPCGVKVLYLKLAFFVIVVIPCSEVAYLEGIGQHLFLNHVLPVRPIKRCSGQLLHRLRNVQLEPVISRHHLKLLKALRQLHLFVYRDTSTLLVLCLPLLVYPLHVGQPLLILLLIP